MSKDEFKKEEYEKAFKKSFDEKEKEFDELRNKELVISLIGSVNAGKSQTINALTGIKYADVKAKAGSTKEVNLYRLDENVFIADTPGLFDINLEVSKMASDFVEESADVILFFMNANVGITVHDKQAFSQLLKLQKEILVIVNKVDTLDPEEIVEVKDQITEELGIMPYLISAKKGTGIKELHTDLVALLELRGKDLLFLKASKFKRKAVKNWIAGATASAVAIGALPIPGSDILPLTALQVGLAMKIAFIYDIKPSKEDVMKLAASTVTGNIGKQITRWGITALKGAGWIPGAQLLEVAICAIAGSVAGAMTFSFGWACNEYYSRGMNMDLDEVTETFSKFYKDYSARKESIVT